MEKSRTSSRVLSDRFWDEHRWFAWHPVTVYVDSPSRRVIWMRFVRRKRQGGYGIMGDWWYVYRPIDKHEPST